MGFFETIHSVPAYAAGRGDPCGIGSGTSEKELFHKKDAHKGVFFYAFSCSGIGRGLPIVPLSRSRQRKRTYIQGAKACFGVGESACGLGIDAACVCGRVLYGAVCICTLCVQGRCWVFRPLRFTRRSVVAVSPAGPTFIRPMAWSADAKARRGGGI